MSDISLAQAAPVRFEPAMPTAAAVTARHQHALDQLHLAANEHRPIAVLIADGKFEANHVLGSFLNTFDDDAVAVRLTKPYDNALEGMREITRAIGFDPMDLSLADLDNIFGLFVNFQRDHHHRLFVCIEQADCQARWLLDRVRKLVELEEEGRYGLMVILSGQQKLRQMLDHEPLSVVRAKAGEVIRLAPFTLSETTEFVRRRVQATGQRDISEVFEFESINRIHRLSGGVPDLVATLCCKCLQIANQLETGPVTQKIVEDAGHLLWQKSNVDIAEHVNGVPSIESLHLYREKLVVSHTGKELGEFALRGGRFLIGRAKFADLCLTSNNVSRRHALLIRTPADVKIRDLGSTNGTFVNGMRINKAEHIEPGDVITIADCRLEYRVD